MNDFEDFAADMRQQAAVTLRSGDPDLARAVLDQVMDQARQHPGFAPLLELACRIGSGVIAECLRAKQYDEAEGAWDAIRELVGIPTNANVRAQAGQCVYNMLMGHLAAGRMAGARDLFTDLTIWANQEPPHPVLDTLLAEAGSRLIVISLQLKPAAEVYDHYIPMRMAGERHPDLLEIARNRARAALYLIAAFATSDDPNFARTLATELRAITRTDPADPLLADAAEKLEQLYSA